MVTGSEWPLPARPPSTATTRRAPAKVRVGAVGAAPGQLSACGRILQLEVAPSLRADLAACQEDSRGMGGWGDGIH